MAFSSATTKNNSITMEFHRQELRLDENHHNIWKTNITQETIPTNKIAIIICDMWDQHWSTGATERVVPLAMKINDVVKVARKKGIQIIHAPSETLSFYQNSPARKRMLIEDKKEFKKLMKWIHSFKYHKIPLPIVHLGGGSDTPQIDMYKPNTIVWSRQIATIEINEEIDGISDNGAEIYKFLKTRGIEYYFLMGVHTNMCVLGRSFGIKPMTKAGFKVALVRDLTDTMYNPAQIPYVPHDVGTALVCDYIEKFYCASILSKEFLEN
jgi:nicotinamidase-related amidase